MNPKLPKHLIEELDRLVNKLVTAGVEERDQIMSHLEAYEKSGKVPLEVILSMADEDNPALSMYAIQALARNGEPKAVEKLVALVESHRQGNPMVLETVVEALGRTGSPAGTDTLLGLLGLRRGWKGKLQGLLGRRNAEPEDADAAMREHVTLAVVRALENIGDPEAARLLGAYLEHPDPLVRWHTLKNIANTGVTDHNDKVRELAQNDGHDLVREMAEITLERLKTLPKTIN